MKKNTTVDITPMSDAELDGVLGARGEGWVVTVTKDCHANTKMKWLGCC
ncbi:MULTISPECIES: lacticin 481 family lantibiotic [Corynebacterium]|uniref:Type A2 lanthipeptide n=1 Tax=Corynebacterium singulare TaxID=161899 RepID=A0ABS9PSP4_9CORY|nr:MULTISPECIES: lacticin 481 family lantibiotic [Corynebacterium]MCG7228373.1 type A2 lanthipeptide [Corynebacterium minutissimum]MCG7238443.1 type A2 lanthipeptide [Corynebacterium minutissimum]MCG7275141.1 type A2 lanthipeptide [Corynebacterium singulare]